MAGLGVAAAGLVAARLGPSAVLGAETYLAATGAVLAVHDATTRRLPNLVVVGSYPIEALLLILASSIDGAWGALWRAGVGAVVLGGCLRALALVFPGQLGMGDPKLAALYAMGLAWWGWPTLLCGVLGAWALAALWVLGRAVAGRRGAVPFAPFLLAGALLALWATR